MVLTAHLIGTLKDRVIAGGAIEYEEALALIEIEDVHLADELLKAAHEITLAFHANRAGLCSLINAKSYLCGEDCGFCSQSVRYETSAARYELLEPEIIIGAAKKAEQQGAQNFCIVTSGGSLSDDEFERIEAIVKQLGEETDLGIDASLGFLTPERVRRLKEAGLRRFNSNLQTSREFYPTIVSTHSYDTRIETLEHLRDGGVEVCSGGILGMGETREDRVKMAFELKRFAPECLPVNILNPRPGTPLEHAPKLEPFEILKTIAVYRFILPRSNIKLAGGREVNLTKEEQEKALKGGANGLILGGYLTTAGNPVTQDLNMLRRIGYEV
ncbi:MAG: biotin synthase BioB [Omnitrophica bacterium RIFCSPLOWO2_12_FULL_50_11]|nr:MAG: biotin synthase BioB [Omnitrophica bacterium RIFCSPLOWO2_12_FULL_50_11]